jgi:hypothetical protein
VSGAPVSHTCCHRASDTILADSDQRESHCESDSGSESTSQHATGTASPTESDQRSSDDLASYHCTMSRYYVNERVPPPSHRGHLLPADTYAVWQYATSEQLQDSFRYVTPMGRGRQADRERPGQQRYPESDLRSKILFFLRRSSSIVNARQNHIFQ